MTADEEFDRSRDRHCRWRVRRSNEAREIANVSKWIGERRPLAIFLAKSGEGVENGYEKMLNNLLQFLGKTSSGSPIESEQRKKRAGGMKISVFGLGYLGTILCACLPDLGHEVIGVDVAEEKVSALANGRTPIFETGVAERIRRAVDTGKLAVTLDSSLAVGNTDISFVAVDTPAASDGRMALESVTTVLNRIGVQIARKTGAHTVVMRSTTPPGTAENLAIPILEQASGRRHGDRLRYYVNPEFLREGMAVTDFFASPMTLVGHAPGDDAAIFAELYAGMAAPMRLTSYGVAEGVKFLSNVFHAVKIAFANEAGATLAALGVDARKAFEILCEDRRLNISGEYLRPGFAFGGPCLPKDLTGFLGKAEDARVQTPFLSHLLASNEAVIDRTLSMIAPRPGLRVALLGVAFKAGTDDLRNSPYVALAERLIEAGVRLRIHDRHVRDAETAAARTVCKRSEESPFLPLLTLDLESALEGSEMVIVGHISAADREALPHVLGNQSVVDLVGISELERHPRIAYRGLCW